ncbi:MAG TPA: acyltransferase, partial [Polyangia bacterium]|nr:acyltransferase [Polyangia bacterium]
AVLWERSWANFIYVSNYTHGNDANILKIGWSLCIEEHFYLALPLVLWAVFRVRREWLRIALLSSGIALPLLFRFYRVYTATRGEELLAIYNETHFRMDPLFMGVLLAFLHVRHHEWIAAFVDRFRWPVLAVAAVCFMGVLWSVVPFSTLALYTYQYSVATIGGAALVLHALYVDGVLARFLGSRFFVPFARVSYGTYLLHLFVIAVIVTAVKQLGPIDYISVPRMFGVYLAAQVMAPAVAAVMFLGLELPLQRIGRRISSPRRIEGDGLEV